MLERLLSNHVLANLTFAVVLVIGTLAYVDLPRQQDPTINFNWIDITTFFPGASAADVEKQVTDILEEAVAKLSDVRFVSSTSREGVSSILVRFQDIDGATFDKRVNDLRREIQNKEGELPAAVETPAIFEVTSANAFPTATLVITGPADDENLRRQADAVRKDLERMAGVDSVMPVGLRDPELQVLFDPQRLETLGLSPAQLADTVSAYYRDVSAGTVQVRDESWLVRLSGAHADPAHLARLPVTTASGEVALGSLAEVVRGRKKADNVVHFDGRPAILLGITKQGDTNLLELVGRVTAYVQTRNAVSAGTGVRLVLVDDQTEITRNALSLMQNNAVVGLAMVLVVSWLFLGGPIALLTCIGIPFILAGTFWTLSLMDQTLNVTVLLGVVIALGMLVDDAVVVVEAVFYRLQRGYDAVTATVDALREVAAPVLTAVLTTVAAFLPLMLMPGILGKFMRVVPLVVSVALVISLIEAFWMLPAHVSAARVDVRGTSGSRRRRIRFLAAVRRGYTRILLRVLRYPKTTLLGCMLMMTAAGGAVAAGMIRFDFFASDPLRLFYVNIEMPTGTPLTATLEKTLAVERKVRSHLTLEETRAVVSYAGQAFTDTAPQFGDQYGQVMVGLRPAREGLRGVDAVIDSLRADVEATQGARVTVLRLAGGPPSGKPISIKVRGDTFDELRAAAAELKAVMATLPGVRDIGDDDVDGLMELRLELDLAAVHKAGVDPQEVARNLALLVDGLVGASLQDRGETVDVRVRARPENLTGLDQLLRVTLPVPGGGRIALSELTQQTRGRGQGSIRHYDFRRAITVEADIAREITDTVAANAAILTAWDRLRERYPNIDLDFSGELDDIQESLDAIGVLFLFGLGLIYLILGTQFRSYLQPLMILATVPLAITGVVLGLLVTGNPLSLFTLYGVVALAGIAVNSAIVLISAANDRLALGMSVLHATVYAARRRVIPILITSLTTIAGLFSLATGLAGHSLIWGPVATSIVSGLAFSTVLTLLVIPIVYRLSMRRAGRHSSEPWHRLRLGRVLGGRASGDHPPT